MLTELDVYHIDDSIMSYALSSNKAVIRLRVRHGLNISDIRINYGPKYKFKFNDYRTKQMSFFVSTNIYDYYQAVIDLDDRRLSYFFEFKVDEDKCFYTEDGITQVFHDKLWQYSLFQIGYINDDDIMYEVSWAKDAVFYQIFPERFNIGNKNKDMSYVNLKHGQKVTSMSFYGGDLQGIIDKLDYLEELGVNTLYLTPIFKSCSNHKYNIADYKMIDPSFGDMNTFKELVEKLHARNMKIVLDAVFNHCSFDHPYFMDAVEKGKDSKYFNWFIVHGDKIITDKKKYNYDAFGLGNWMPKFNTCNKEVENYLLDIALYYIKEFDIDGWRLDVADEVSHSFWREFRNKVKQIKKDCIILGEVWPDAHSFLTGDQFDSVMNYPLRKALINYFMHHEDGQTLVYDLNKCLINNTSIVNNMMYNLLDSHDSARFFTEIDENVDKFKQALLTNFFFVGMPALYYGDEIHLKGGQDPDCRRPMIFSGKGYDNNFREFVKQVIKLRKETKQLKEGEIKLYVKDDMFHLERSCDKVKITLILNNNHDFRRVDEKGDVLMSNLFDSKSNVLSNNGFVVIKEGC